MMARADDFLLLSVEADSAPLMSARSIQGNQTLLGSGQDDLNCSSGRLLPRIDLSLANFNLG
jgi:hypothetical protein